ncbi:Phosphoglucomutase-2 [Lobulomyces angularis]|nr:Phosphoglucomutase-2 [Lobulomyces angularis]
MSSSFTAATIEYIKPFTDQNPGTSGLRKRTKVFQQKYYSESFIQATLSNVVDSSDVSLLVGGDGRYWSEEICQTIIKLSAGNKVKTVYVAKDSILSTPAASNLIRTLKLSGGFLLTASHNPGGPDYDFGIKYNCGNGGPAPEKLTNAIYQKTLEQNSYTTVSALPIIDLKTLASYTFEIQNALGESWSTTVHVIDAIKDYVTLMKEIFDFPTIQNFLKKSNAKILLDSMNGVTGPYATQILVNELKLNNSSVMNNVPKADFGGIHPDPNLTYAASLAEKTWSENIDLGAASDGDGDRNMIVAKDNVFVNPSDSVAVIADNAHLIPFFKKSGVKGLARSMPTSMALDRVAKRKNLQFYEVPTGWKFFGNLMDAGKLSICGEESFGTGSDHIREKDGIWAILAWLNILAASNAEKTFEQGFIGVKEILENHYRIYGRNYFTRYDYEEVSSEGGAELMKYLRNLVSAENKTHVVGKKYTGNGETYVVKKCDDFSYTDPVDGSVSQKQGVYFVFEDESRIVYRASGTGSQGATIRVYVEKYEATNYLTEASTALSGLVSIAKELGKIKEFTGRDEPTVIT